MSCSQAAVPLLPLLSCQARKYASVAITLIDIMMYQSEFPCFTKGGQKPLRQFQARLLPKLSDAELERKARSMVDHSLNHLGTRLYDKFQLYSNKIEP